MTQLPLFIGAISSFIAGACGISAAIVNNGSARGQRFVVPQAALGGFCLAMACTITIMGLISA